MPWRLLQEHFDTIVAGKRGYEGDKFIDRIRAAPYFF
jgi:hypothetical protein